MRHAVKEQMRWPQVEEETLVLPTTRLKRQILCASVEELFADRVISPATAASVTRTKNIANSQ